MMIMLNSVLYVYNGMQCILGILCVIVLIVIVLLFLFLCQDRRRLPHPCCCCCCPCAALIPLLGAHCMSARKNSRINMGALGIGDKIHINMGAVGNSHQYGRAWMGKSLIWAGVDAQKRTRVKYGAHGWAILESYQSNMGARASIKSVCYRRRVPKPMTTSVDTRARSRAQQTFERGKRGKEQKSRTGVAVEASPVSPVAAFCTCGNTCWLLLRILACGRSQAVFG